MRPQRPHNTKVQDLVGRLAELGNVKPKGPDDMRRWLRERRWLTRCLEAIGPPR
jgi:hypothetical protein